MKCRECKEEFEPSNHGRKQAYCTVRCRMRSYRRRVTQDRQMPPEKPSPARRSPGGTKKPVKDWETAAKRPQVEVRNLSRRLAAFQRPTLSMAIMIDRVKDRKKPIRYLARELNGSEWAQGPTPKEALGALVHHFALMRPLTVESVDFSY